MSFALTEDAIRDRTKDVTRRLGWKFAKVGDRLLAVDKLRTKKAEKLAVIEVVNVRREPLSAITWHDVQREGFWKSGRYEFIPMFCEANHCLVDEEWLRKYTLRDLIEANEIVNGLKTKNADGSTAIPMVCADRLTAAIYAALHYSPEPNGGTIRPAATLHDRALAIVALDAEKNLRESDEVPA